MKIKYFGFVIVCLVIVWSCTNDDFCLSNQNAVQVGFYSRSVAVEKDSILSGIHVHRVGLVDTLLPYDSVNVKNLFLPLNFHGDTEKDSTGFVIRQRLRSGDEEKINADTIVFYHRKELVFISGECGMFYNMIIDSLRYTTIFIDTVRMEYPHVKYDENIENVKIYIQY